MTLRAEPGPLAHYRTISEYAPNYGDFIVWSGWFSTWHGVVANFDKDSGELTIIFAGVPFLLFTMEDDEHERESRKIKLSQIRGSSHGAWAVLQHDFTRNANIWYI